MKQKKIYQTPQVELIEIELPAVICTSTFEVEDYGMDDLPSEPGRFGF